MSTTTDVDQTVATAMVRKDNPLSRRPLSRRRAMHITIDVVLALIVVALLMIVACWVWASLIMRLPAEERVFP